MPEAVGEGLRFTGANYCDRARPITTTAQISPHSRVRRLAQIHRPPPQWDGDWCQFVKSRSGRNGSCLFL